MMTHCDSASLHILAWNNVQPHSLLWLPQKMIIFVSENTPQLDQKPTENDPMEKDWK